MPERIAAIRGKANLALTDMCKSAAEQHVAWSCLVGGGSDHDLGETHGLGCTIDAHHILTARHCWSCIRNQYSWPLVFRNDGLFRCEVVYESSVDDIMILKAMRPIRLTSLPCPSRFPRFHRAEPEIGANVGFIARRILRNDPTDESEQLDRVFLSGTISSFLPAGMNRHRHLMITDVVYQAGSSGAAVFLPDGGVVGVLTRGVPIQPTHSSGSAEWHTWPVATSILPLITQIEVALGNDRHA